MNQDQLSTPGNPEVPASVEALVKLRDRIGDFVQAHGSQVTFPEGTRVLDTGNEPPRPLVLGEDLPAVYLTFPGWLLEKIAPDAARRLRIDQLTLSRDVPTYSYIGDGPIPSEPHAIGIDRIFDSYWSSGGGSGVFISNLPDAPTESTFYKLSANGVFLREPTQREGGRPTVIVSAPS